MSNKFMNEPSIKILLDRREEIRNEVNKLQAEYSAIGELIRQSYNKKNIIIEKDDEERC